MENIFKINLEHYLKYSIGKRGMKKRFVWFNPLSANPTNWSNTLKQFVGNTRVCLTILSVFECVDHFMGL